METVTMMEVSHVQYLLRSDGVGVRGVNLGGWLVAEQWMSSNADIWRDMPEGASSEGEFQVLSNGNNRQQSLANFDEAPLRRLSSRRRTSLRLREGQPEHGSRVPVGYWIMGSDP